MRNRYSDVNWFLRAARVLPVIAGAALLGSMIGGFAMFAIDSALTWDPVSQPRSEARDNNAATVSDVQATKPARIVGGAIPDPSVGMSAPPPAPQQRSAAAPAQQPSQQLSSQLLTSKPLGPASQLQPQTATAGSTSGAPQQNQSANQSANQVPVPQATIQQRWPDALSRAHQNATNTDNANGTQQQTMPPPAANANSARQTTPPPASVQASGDRTTATTGDQERSNTRHGRHSRRHTVIGTNGSRNGADDDAAASAPRRPDARSYDRLYDSYGNRRDQRYGNTRERPYGDVRGDQDDAASWSGPSRSDTRRFGRDTRYRSRWRGDEDDRNQAFEPRPRPEPFWGGGFFRRGNGWDD